MSDTHFEIDNSSVIYNIHVDPKLVSSHYDEICRVCLRSKDLLRGDTYFNLYTKITQIHAIPEYLLPTGVCKSCYKKLQQINDFLTFCSETNSFLIKIIAASTYNPSKGSADIVKKHRDDETTKKSTSIQGLVDKQVVSNISSDSQNDTFLELKNTTIVDDIMAGGELNNTFDMGEGIFFALSVDSSVAERDSVLNVSESKEKKTTPLKSSIPNAHDDQDEIIYSLLRQCLFCDEEIVDAEFARTHLFSHKPYECDLCPCNFELLCDLIVHQENSHVTDDVRTNCCEFCNKKFFSELALIIHQVEHSPSEDLGMHWCASGMSPSDAVLPSNDADNNTLASNSTVNDVLFVTKSVDDNMVTINASRSHAQNEDIILLCHICGASFTKTHYLNVHLTRHPEHVIVACPLCALKFANITALDKHVCSHPETNPYQCDVCKERFMNEAHLLLHGSVHEGRSPFACPRCNRMYDEWHELSAHVRTHFQEDKHECPLCSKLFASHYALITHLNRHKMTSNDSKPKEVLPIMNQSTNESMKKSPKRKECPYCKKTFKHSIALKSHILTHTGEKPFQCELCHKRFVQTSHLASHKLTHTGEKRHSCPICGKKFALRGNMVCHYRTHTGETRFYCEICGKGYYHYSKLKKHYMVCGTQVLVDSSLSLSTS